VVGDLRGRLLGGVCDDGVAFRLGKRDAIIEAGVSCCFREAMRSGVDATACEARCKLRRQKNVKIRMATELENHRRPPRAAARPLEDSAIGWSLGLT
jgi:hypothetical protein